MINIQIPFLSPMRNSHQLPQPNTKAIYSCDAFLQMHPAKCFNANRNSYYTLKSHGMIYANRIIDQNATLISIMSSQRGLIRLVIQ
ncbi:unnamed protein product [Paramecium octaurelia]|uniref:Uncharacterized protein n=1 Tax=Paramecium octaurelia TaxID=43137 RepID=A0A8S1YNS0_PAROT|nr:unnamed protein product [Paramecium octaurelia]